MTSRRVSLFEWETKGPDGGSELAGQNFGRDEAVRRVAERLTSLRQLAVLELARGLELRATSFVGRIRLGEIEVTIHPKISGAPLLNLFRYAYGLRDLHLYGGAIYSTARQSFQDLLIQQLGTEVQELLTRGLHRDYLSISENLASPRGRIDFTRYFQSCQTAKTALPCIHHPRREDNLLNQILLAGVLLGARLSTDFDLRSRMRRLSKVLGATVSKVQLDATTFREAWRALDRRTTAYESSLKLVELLMGNDGVSLSDAPARLKLRGFLFDMNRFFQALMSRFLREHLTDCEVQDEHRLKGMFAYDPQQNPQNRKAPTLRPDFVVKRGQRIAAVLDAKYRDLWEQSLPPAMLYQLALYALGHDGNNRQAAILYPTLNSQAVEQSIVVQEAVQGSARAHVDLRPVNLLLLDQLLRGKGQQFRRQRTELARRLAFSRQPDPQGSITGN